MTLKDKIIYKLEKERNNFISGQDIADEFGVSRNAVAKSIASLKTEGFLIESVNNSGHRLLNESDVVSEFGIRAYLNDNENTCVKVFKTIDSTNNEAKRAVADGLTENAVFVADQQTAGRGRRGRDFFSPEKSGLYFTAVLHPDASLSDSVGITAATAVIVVELIREITKKHPLIKWVNDIFIDGRKVCGILTEAISDFDTNRVQAVIIGIGINLTTEDFPKELSSIAGSVGSINRCYLAAQLFERLKDACENIKERSFMDAYKDYSLVIGKDIYFTRNGVDYTGTALGIMDDGGLIVKTPNGVMKLDSGEISIKLDK